MTPAQMQAVGRQVKAAELLMTMADAAGVSKSPSQVRHEIAVAIGDACSQSTVRRLIANLEALSS